MTRILFGSPVQSCTICYADDICSISTSPGGLTMTDEVVTSLECGFLLAEWDRSDIIHIHMYTHMYVCIYISNISRFSFIAID